MLRFFASAATAILLFSISQWGFASGVACPVCGQVFEEGTAVCPNDGTDLTLLGKPPETEIRASDAAQASEDEEADSGKTAPGTSPVRSSGGYKRHDESAEKKASGEKDSAGYSDRRSRLPSDDRTAGSIRHKKTSNKKLPSAEPTGGGDNAAVFARYEKDRLSSWKKHRPELSNADAEKDRSLSRTRLFADSAAPFTSFGGRIFFLGEQRTPGLTGGAEVDFHFSKILAKHRLRAGASGFFGIRVLDARKEPVFLESLFFGVQLPGRFSPFAAVRGGLGTLVARRFETDRAYLITGLGVEVGMDAWINVWVSVSTGVGFIRCTIKDAYWNSVTFKLSFGFL